MTRNDSPAALSRVDFYVLARARTEDKHAYACRIADKAHARGMTVFMRAEDDAQSESLDKLLWTFSQGSFVPHIRCAAVSNEDAGADDSANDDAIYPVRIGSHAPSRAADLLISLTREAPADYARFARVADLILDHADDKAAGRARFRFYREQGIAPNTHNIADPAAR
ncbi:MAG: DNA polymerase III subunit chi [bacterium]